MGSSDSESTLAGPASAVPVADHVATSDLGAGVDGAMSETLVGLREARSWGVLPVFAVIAGGALLVMAGADALSRTGRPGGQALFWIALLLPFTVAAFRLASPAPSRKERVGIVVVLGLTFYFMKVLQYPLTFLYPDEFVHGYNAQRTLDTDSLFSENPLIKITPHYPGLATVTNALASLTGLHVFGAGVVIVGVARAVLMLMLFLLFEEASRSTRVAGMATLFYAAHPNFLFFSSEYAYESLALPIAVAATVGVTRWMSRDTLARRAWALTALIATSGVVITHHMTSYALVAFLVAVSLVHRLFARWPYVNPWRFALFAFVATLVWLVFVASETVGYLKPIFYYAFRSTIQAVQSEGATRQLFSSETVHTPVMERVIALAGVGLIALAMPLALWEVHRRFRTSPVVLVMSAAGCGYLVMLLFRFVPTAWEISNRASEYLFIGVALMLGLVAVRLVGRRQLLSSQLAVGAAAALIFAGGVMAGWPRDLRLAQAYRIDVHGTALEPQGTTAARWAATSKLGTGRRFVADPSNARLMLAQGVEAFAGTRPPFNEILRHATLDPWMVELLTNTRVSYVIMDRRQPRDDPGVNYFFTSRRHELYPPEEYEKLERQPGVSRLFDSGDVVIYSIRRLRYDSKRP